MFGNLLGPFSAKGSTRHLSPDEATKEAVTMLVLCRKQERGPGDADHDTALNGFRSNFPSSTVAQDIVRSGRVKPYIMRKVMKTIDLHGALKYKDEILK